MIFNENYKKHDLKTVGSLHKYSTLHFTHHKKKPVVLSVFQKPPTAPQFPLITFSSSKTVFKLNSQTIWINFIMLKVLLYFFLFMACTLVLALQSPENCGKKTISKGFSHPQKYQNAISQCSFEYPSKAPLKCPNGTSCKLTMSCEKNHSKQEKKIQPQNNLDYWCGKTFQDARNCHHPCPEGSSMFCPVGMSCFDHVNVCLRKTGKHDESSRNRRKAMFGQLQEPTADPQFNWCGSNWEDAGRTCSEPCGENFSCEEGECQASVYSCAPGDPTVQQPVTIKQGYFEKTFAKRNENRFEGADISIAFSGKTNIEDALSDSEDIYDTLVGEKYISIGGGGGETDPGAILKSTLDALDRLILCGDERIVGKYDGILYDVEVGSINGYAGAEYLEGRYERSFQIARSKKLSVILTVSGSAPYAFSDDAKKSFMDSMLQSKNIDYLSPQLYGYDPPMFDLNPAEGYLWENWKGTEIPILPVLLDNTDYEAAENLFSSLGMPTEGWLNY